MKIGIRGSSDKIHLQKDRPKNAYKVALLQFSNPKYAKTYFKLIEDVKCYADRHGYAHILETRPITKSTNYGKIGLAVKEMEKNYDVIVGLDVDVIIGNHSKRVEEFLTPNQGWILFTIGYHFREPLFFPR